MQVLKRPPYQLLDGDFVRAEARLLAAPGAGPGSKQAANHRQQQEQRQEQPEQQQEEEEEDQEEQQGSAAGLSGSGVRWRVVKKDEALGFSNCVVRIMTNRKVAWQARKRS